jgi:hypothetical protein
MNSKVLLVWSMSLKDFSHFHMECPCPLSSEEVEDVLEFMDISRRQIAKFGIQADPPTSARQEK